MNQADRDLIRCVVYNNLFGAKKYAQQILESNKDKKSQEKFCKEMLEFMQQDDYMDKIIPMNVKEFIIMENPSDTFIENRYYLSDREKELVDNIIKTSKVTERLSEIGINYLNSTMLYGESGTGKTTFGRYIAYKMNLPFILLNLSTLIDSKLGSTTKNIANVFNFVKQYKCVFMIDEIDAIGMKRGQSHEVGELARIVISLMQELDKLKGDTILLAATNRLDILDTALRRRFRNEHEVTTLNEEERKCMVQLFFKDVDYNISDTELNNLIKNPITQDNLMKSMIKILVDYYNTIIDKE